jgi:hypothetical protein
LIHKDGSISVPFPSDSAVEMNDSFTENLKWDSMTTVAMLQIYISLKTHSSLKSVML